MQLHTVYSGLCSAAAYLYRRAGLPMPTEMARQFKEYVAGRKRTGSKEKQDLSLAPTTKEANSQHQDILVVVQDS